MLVRQPNALFLCDPHDVLLILFDVTTRRYHTTFFEWSPFPGERVPDPHFLRLKSKMHHTEGSATYEGVLVQFKELRDRLVLPDTSCVSTHVYPWEGDLGRVWIVNPWGDRPFNETNVGFTAQEVEARAQEGSELHG